MLPISLPGTSRRRTRATRLLLAVAGTLAFASGIDAASSDAWRIASGVRTHNEEATAFELYTRGSNAVVREFREGELLSDTRCIDGDYQAADYVAESLVEREGFPAQDCLRWATGSFADGYEIARQAGLALVESVDKGGRVLDRFVGPDRGDVNELVVDRASSLPTRLVRKDSVVEWSYGKIGTVATVPAFVDSVSGDAETYRSMTRADAAVGIGLRPLPARFGRFEFDSALEYRPDRNAGRTYYAFWIREDGAEIQVVRGVGPVDPSEAGSHDIGGSVLFKKQLGSDYVYVLAPDAATLDAVLTALALQVDTGTP